MTNKTLLDNAELLRLQDAYLATRDPKDFLLLWKKSTDVAKSIILNIRKKKGFYLSNDDLQERANIATMRIMRRYKKIPDKPAIHAIRGYYKIESNYISAIWFSCLYALFNNPQRHADQENKLYTEKLSKDYGEFNEII